MVQPGARLNQLDHERCLPMLVATRRGSAGLAFTGRQGPVATTTPYEVVGSSIVLPRLPAEVVATMAAAQLVLVRVDHVHPGHHSGWAITLVGTLRPPGPFELALWPLAGLNVVLGSEVVEAER